MQRTGFWGSPWSLLLFLLILPPLGLVMLWVSRRSLFVQVVVSALALVYMGILGSAAYNLLAQTRVPDSGFDVSRNALGHYRTPRVLDLEAEVSDAVVRLQKEGRLRSEPVTDEGEAEPNAKIFEAVASQFGLTSEEVRDIYLKVSILQAQETRKK